MRPNLAVCYGQERLPRYTSYPTAPHFSPAIAPATYAEWLKAIPRRASASLYVHVPFLPLDVLVLRLSHHGGAARPADRGI